MKFNKTLAAISAAAALLAAPLAAQAVPTFQLKISDGITDFIITDGDGNDASAFAGSIAWSGTYGDYSFNIASGTSQFDPLNMHLFASAQLLTLPSPDHVLTIELTQTGLAQGAPGTVQFFGGGGITSDGVGSWEAFADANDMAFGTTTSLFGSTGNGSFTSSNTLNATGSTYSATLRAQFDFQGLTPQQAGSIDLDLNVPEPGSLALAGLALVGLAAARRRKV